MLTANCRTTTGQYKCSKLDLNNCIKNSYGRLQEDPTGSGPHFGDPNQCLECSNNSPSNGLTIGITPALLWCKCNPGTGAAQASWPTAIFDLNTVVTNRNGVLECFKSKGTSC
ncbi:uncharacterized protein CTHT_0068720 [Thermochaetoides thermophila DSM 1495]|uniref:Cyanovirin-N domain-containing protein n=1 Tax=Chaetomium thermophilum (strain DSM 1495 / CBS 144.50 / IMI 039719) TaxID=759272 RepID=G0SH52_CHATD|nr:hypothetical protein CTHT_0068720 [Thermochaetoides thermophila DSM 1495]EGS17541.1 hypothetical protein CTHT_0068720 [Thermochaetoides thermophila DSM 1495]